LRPEYTILIADRNSNVREFLKREMIQEGFKVLQAKKGKEAIRIIFHCSPLDLVILDPDLPDMEETGLLKKIGARIPPLPIIIHAFDSEEINYLLYLKQAVYVEKGGQSIEKLKQVVSEIIRLKKNNIWIPKILSFQIKNKIFKNLYLFQPNHDFKTVVEENMKTVQVKDVMVALEDYATVSEDATLYEAVLALEKAQEQYEKSHYPHRSILVYDSKNKIVGKISQLDILMALEPNYRIVDLEKLSRFGYSLEYMQAFAKTALWDKPLRDICRKAATYIVKDFMHTPKQGEYIKEDSNLDEAIHQLLIGRHNSLLVTRNDDIVGILRQSDVYTLVCENIKACEF
jgi:CBS domain-containing protein